ncbi:basic blue protein-like [Oryza brachyantha]|uniref:Phytocyanin domain-containing protein n=1 Tax=Oryza brachyantha TaxID=4533 RepID=J3N7W9_ORYBR|nr:basic blue protein-like [Oryza brachyantha]
MGRYSLGLVVLGLLALAFSTTVMAETHVVGDSKGWDYSVSFDSWADGKVFATGDTLVFNYKPGAHNVLAVDAATYRSCKVSSPDSVAAATGTASFLLKKGANYFICGVAGHCAAGMKLRVVAN